MKYGFFPRAMWAVFAGYFKKATKEILPCENAKTLMKKARVEYKNILSDVDEFDKGSRFVFNIYSCAMLSAFLLHFENKYDVETIRRYYAFAMNNGVVRAFARKSDVYTPKGRERLKKMRKRKPKLHKPLRLEICCGGRRRAQPIHGDFSNMRNLLSDEQVEFGRIYFRNVRVGLRHGCDEQHRVFSAIHSRLRRPLLRLPL